MDCLVCATPDSKRPMIMRGEAWCCDGHRKVVKGEIKPTQAEWITMTAELKHELIKTERNSR